MTLLHRTLIASVCLSTILCSNVIATPKLGVVVVFDQMGADTLQRNAALFGPGGFGGLMDRGAAHWDVAYATAATETAPGHATLATGSDPSSHHVPLNGWFKEGKYWFSVRDDDERIVGDDPESKRPGVSADVLAVPTLGDTLKAFTYGRAKVVSLSLKDRAAILSGGPSVDVALFFDRRLARFTTSTAIATAVPAWAAPLVVSLPKKSMEQGTWSPLETPPALLNRLPDDDVEGEGQGFGFDRVFPHDLKVAPEEKRARLYPGTPQSMNDLFTLARAAVVGEGLGDDDIPDLLIVSISTTDYIGHWWGPDSLEGVDIYRRADLALRDFLTFLDDKIGRGQFALAVVGDHGGSPLPERVSALGVNAGRLHSQVLIADVDKALKKFGPRPPSPNGDHDAHENADASSRVEGFVSPHLFLSLDDLDTSTRAQALAAARNAALKVEGVAAVYRVDAFEKDADPFVGFYRASVVEGRSGALLIRPRPFWIFSGRYRTGIAHGSHLRHDRVVPFFLVGPRVQRGRRGRMGFARDVAPTLARQLGVPPPAGATGEVLSDAQRRPFP